ncbi:MAG: hypothetical protein OXG08_04585 [Gammaproteobacteria bacterium]|nr:hypothetical protein [Gammaproteobacteria bacterium]
MDKQTFPFMRDLLFGMSCDELEQQENPARSLCGGRKTWNLARISTGRRPKAGDLTARAQRVGSFEPIKWRRFQHLITNEPPMFSSFSESVVFLKGNFVLA